MAYATVTFVAVLLSYADWRDQNVWSQITTPLVMLLPFAYSQTSTTTNQAPVSDTQLREP